MSEPSATPNRSYTIADKGREYRQYATAAKAYSESVVEPCSVTISQRGQKWTATDGTDSAEFGPGDIGGDPYCLACLHAARLAREHAALYRRGDDETPSTPRFDPAERGEGAEGKRLRIEHGWKAVEEHFEAAAVRGVEIAVTGLNSGHPAPLVTTIDNGAESLTCSLGLWRWSHTTDKSNVPVVSARDLFTVLQSLLGPDSTNHPLRLQVAYGDAVDNRDLPLDPDMTTTWVIPNPGSLNFHMVDNPITRGLTVDKPTDWPLRHHINVARGHVEGVG